MRAITKLTLLLMVSLPLLTCHELAAESKVKYYKFLKIVHGKTFLTPGKIPADVSVDSRGGEVVIKIKMTRRCIESSKFTWGFNKDIDILKPGDSFDVEGHAWTMPDDCYKERTPYFWISGSKGRLMAKSIFNRLGSNERKGASRGKRLVTGSTSRIYASRGGETKAATINVRKNAASSHIWFLLQVVATSPIVSSNESIDYSIVYLYEAVY